MTLTRRTHSNDFVIASDEQQQFGRFVLLELLSDDVESQVYRAIHQRLRKQVALMLLIPRHEENAQTRAQHLDACRVLCHLTHPNLVRVETAGEHDGTPYLVLEFVAGVDLQSVLVSIGPLTLADACQLICQAAAGLNYLHEQDLTHGRVRLENLVLTGSGQLKIVGLGQTRLRDFPGECAVDLCDLAHTLCELMGWRDSVDLGTSPELFKAIQRLKSDQNPRSKPLLHEFIEILAQLSIGSDLHKLLTQLDITPEANSKDSLMLAHPLSGRVVRSEERDGYEFSVSTYQPEAGRPSPSDGYEKKTIPQRTPEGLPLALCMVFALGIGGVFLGSHWWNFDKTEIATQKLVANTRPASSGLSAVTGHLNSEIATDDLSWEAVTNPPSTDELHHPVKQTDDILQSIEADRDAFDLQVKSTDQGFEFTNLEKRGIVQLPLIMPERFTLECTVERLEGDGSFAFGFSAGDARMMALFDHQVEGQWQSGMFFVGSDGKSGIMDPYSEQFLIEGIPRRLRLDVSPEHAELLGLELSSLRPASVDSPDVRLGGWTKSDHNGARPTLGGTDGYHPQTFFVHTYQGAFRVADVRIIKASADAAAQPFSGPNSRKEIRLAQRIVWRGGHVEIITEAGTRTVHRLQDLTDDPWLIGIEKCPAAPRLMIGDTELRELANINGIRKLDLSDSQVTAEGLATVTGLQSLAVLALPQNGIDGSVLASLRDLPALRQLRLIGVSLDDDDVEELARFPKLTSLCLSSCPINDAAVAKVARELPELEHLCLSGTKITGDCLSELSLLGALKDLQLHETAVDDYAIANLPPLPQLQKLSLHGSSVSVAAIDKLRQERPGLEIK